MDARLHETAGNPAPPGTPVVGFFKAFDGRAIRYAIFRNDGASTATAGTIVLLQGRNESIEKYYETIADLNARGFWVATFDWRGQGGSERLLKNPMKGFVRRYRDYERDLETFLETIVLPDTRLPFFLVAHSMGGLVALSAAPRLGNRIERMVLLAPFVELGGQALGRGPAGFITRLFCLLGFGRLPVSKLAYPRPFERNGLTSDAARFARNEAIGEAVPALRLGPPTARWTLEMIKAMNRVETDAHLGAIGVPTLVLAPSRDAIVPAAALERLDLRFRAGHLITIDGARHEVLQERDLYRAQALAAIEAFLLPMSEQMPAALELEADGPET